MPVKPRATARRTKDALVCTFCGSDKLDYVEECLISRRVASYERETKSVFIDSHFDCEGDGDNQRIQCRNCGKDQRFPQGVEIVWQ